MTPNVLGRFVSSEGLLSQEMSSVPQWLVRLCVGFPRQGWVGMEWDGMGISATTVDVVPVLFTGVAALALSSSLESK